MKKIKMGCGGKMRTAPISELLEQRIEFQTITSNAPLLAFTIAEGVINPEDKKSNKRDFLMKDKDNKRFELTEKDDIIYNPANVVFGAIHRNALGKGVVSPIYKIFKCVNVDPLYMDCVVSRASFIHELSKYTEGSVTKLRTLAPESFLNLELTVPTDIDEQHKIGILIESLKTKIENEKKQTEKLKVLKASMLDKMFPKKGATEPEIRFDGFTDAWEQRKLDEAFDFTVPNNTLSRAELNQESGSVQNVHYGDVLIKYSSVLDVQNDDLPFITGRSKEDFRGALLQDGDIIIADTAEDETTGKACEIVNIQDKAVVAGLHTMVCRPRNKTAEGYFGYYLNSNSYHHQLLPLMQGIKVLSLNRANVQKTTVKYPKDKAEQQKIADCLRSIDTLITLHQRKYEKLIDTKKAFLEKLIGGEK